MQVVTSNVADILKLFNKGRIAVGKDADLVILDNQNNIVHLLANGKLMKKDGVLIKKGNFE